MESAVLALKSIQLNKHIDVRIKALWAYDKKGFWM